MLGSKVDDHPLGVRASVCCNHCDAQGGSFIEDTMYQALNRAIEDWNQPNLRARTLCDRVKQFWVQMCYDLRTGWGRW